MLPLVGVSLTNVLAAAQVLVIKEFKPSHKVPPVYILLDTIQQNGIMLNYQILCL